MSITGAVSRPAQEIGQAMIVLRPDDEIDGLLPAHDFAAFGLGDAAGDDDLRGEPFGAARDLHFAHFAELGKNLFRRAFANVAGVENDEVRVVQALGFVEARRRQQISHLLRIVSIHLTAI